MHTALYHIILLSSFRNTWFSYYFLLTINRLILYANIVRANNIISSLAKVLISWFIAWLNLDLGIEASFYDRLSGYGKTWLQSFFPVYIWVLVSAIIICSHYSTRAARMCGTNAVQVYACNINAPINGIPHSPTSGLDGEIVGIWQSTMSRTPPLGLQWGVTRCQYTYLLPRIDRELIGDLT